MRLHAGIVRAAIILASVLAALATGNAGDKKNQAKPSGPQMIDSGAFGVFVGGKRVATETFSVQQQDSVSIIKSQVKVETSDPVTQKSDLEITPAGELIKYDWSQSSGGSLQVLPNNEFLIEKITAPNATKPAEQPFLMPNTSAILDNNFLVHREILIWRYLAAACKSEGGGQKCLKDPGEFGVLVPQDRTSMHIRMEIVGSEKISIRGTDRDLMRLNLKGENFDWALWVDEKDQFKLIKVAIPADNTEVVRD